MSMIYVSIAVAVLALVGCGNEDITSNAVFIGNTTHGARVNATKKCFDLLGKAPLINEAQVGIDVADGIITSRDDFSALSARENTWQTARGEASASMRGPRESGCGCGV